MKQMIKRILLCSLLSMMFVTPVGAANYDEDGFIVEPTHQTYISVFNERSNYNSVTLHWWSNSSWDYYKIYRATSENGKYYLIDTVTDNRWIVDGLVTGKDYYFKVRGYNQYGYFESQPIVATPHLNDIVSIFVSDGKVHWGKVAGSQGYAVYRAKDGGTYKKIGTTKVTSYAAKKGYNYKVRAYRKVNGKYYYSRYTKAVKW